MVVGYVVWDNLNNKSVSKTYTKKHYCALEYDRLTLDWEWAELPNGNAYRKSIYTPQRDIYSVRELVLGDHTLDTAPTKEFKYG